MILSDYLAKGDPVLWRGDPESNSTKLFNRRLIAAHSFYSLLLREGILQKAAFEFKEGDTWYQFAIDTDDIPKEVMEKAEHEIRDFALLAEYFHPSDKQPRGCLYCGAVRLGWTMLTYREKNGNVSRSWECSDCQRIASREVDAVREVKENQGTKKAVQYIWEKSLKNLRETKNTLVDKER